MVCPTTRFLTNWSVHTKGLVPSCVPIFTHTQLILFHKKDYFTVVCLVTWPMNASEAAADLALIQTSLLFSCKFRLVSIKTAWFTQKGVRSVSKRRLNRAGTIHSTKISGNFGLKLNASVRPNQSRSAFRKGPLFSDGPVRSKIDRSIWPSNPSTSLFCIFYVQHGGKRLLLQLLDC